MRKPAGWAAPLSIRTSSKQGQDRPYDDAVGPDGFQRYKERSGAAGAAENAALRVAAAETVPLIWFVGLRDGVYKRTLDEIDGPMLRYGLQERHGQQLMAVPRRRVDKPDPVRLEERYELFEEAAR